METQDNDLLKIDTWEKAHLWPEKQVMANVIA